MKSVYLLTGKPGTGRVAKTVRHLEAWAAGIDAPPPDQIFVPDLEQEQRAIKIAVPNVDAASLRVETDFKSDLNLDSVDLVSLVIALEEEFEIDIPEEKFQEIESIKEAIEIISVRTPGQVSDKYMATK